MVCLIFVIAEFVAGIFAKSIAVQADAAHMLTDLMSFGVSLVALRISDMKGIGSHKSVSLYFDRASARSRRPGRRGRRCPEDPLF